MTKDHTPDRWEQRYRNGDVPWDVQRPANELVDCVGELGLTGRAFEIGCGTGTDAIWLGQQGIETLGVDIAPTAIERAREKAEHAGVTNVQFVCCDILDRLPLSVGPVDLVFDRGCFHSMPAETRKPFADRVAEALVAGGYWLTLCGNADAPERTGPPQLSAVEIVSALEHAFEIRCLKRIYFTGRNGPTHLAWSCLARKREQTQGDVT